MEPIKWVENRMPKSEDRQLPVVSLENVAKARRFHSSFPQYAVTPLAQLKASYVLGQESTSNRMNALGRRKLLLGDAQTEDDVLRKIEAVTREETNAIMKRVLSSPCSYAFVGKGAQKLSEEME